MIRCADCLKVIQPRDVVRQKGKCYCPHCGERICRVCGCTQDAPCEDGCTWNFANPEVCSTHELTPLAA